MTKSIITKDQMSNLVASRDLINTVIDGSEIAAPTPVPVDPPSPPPAPPPTPPPVTPPPPIPLSLVPSRVQNASFNSATGTYESKDAWRSDVFALGFSVPAVDYKKTLTLEADVSADMDTAGKNIKVIRGYDGPGQTPIADGRCNVYLGQSPDGWKKLFTEGTSIPAKQQTQEFSFPTKTVRREKWVIVFPSGVGKADGSISRYIDGKLEFSKTGWQFDTTQMPGIQKMWFLQMDYSPNDGDTGPFKAGAWIKVKPVSVSVK